GDRQPLRRATPGPDAPHGDVAQTRAAAARRAHGGPRPEERGSGRAAQRGGDRPRPVDDAHGDPFDAAGGQYRRSPDHDASRADPSRPPRRREGTPPPRPPSAPVL